MSTTIKNIIAEVRTELVQYDSAGMLDEISLRNWANRALKSFGNLVTILEEKTIEVKNGRAKLPEGFYSLYAAVKCQPKRIEMVKGNENDLVDSFFFRVRTEASRVWDNQSNAFQDGEYKEICEKVYLNEGHVEANIYYHQPQLLKLKRGINRESCHNSCRNLVRELTYNCPYEINILGDYIQTNFTDGYIYLQFFTLEKDDEGETVVPELSNDQLVEYLTYHLKRKSLEAVWISDDDAVQNKIQWMLQQERDAYLKAMSAAKIESISGYGWWDTIQKRNRLRNAIYSNFTRR